MSVAADAYAGSEPVREAYRFDVDALAAWMRLNVEGFCGPLWVCAVKRRRFPVGERPTRQVLQPEATGAIVEVTKRLKPSGNACHDIR
jgi:hypothetical protein